MRNDRGITPAFAKTVTKVLTVSIYAALLMITLSCSTPITAMTREGEVQLMSGNYQEAIDTYTRAINLDPKNAAAYLGRAAAYGEMGRFDKSIDDFNSAVALRPTDSEIYVDRGLMFELSGNYQRALQDYIEAVRLDPENGSAHFNCGNVYMTLGETQKALTSYKMAALRGQKDAQAILRSRGITW